MSKKETKFNLVYESGGFTVQKREGDGKPETVGHGHSLDLALADASAKLEGQPIGLALSVG